MTVAIPGIAFGALKEGPLPRECPELWRRVEKYSITLAVGKGLSVHLEGLDLDDLKIIRDCLSEMKYRLMSQPYPVRGIEGTITMRSIATALVRLDEALYAR